MKLMLTVNLYNEIHILAIGPPLVYLDQYRASRQDMLSFTSIKLHEEC